MHIFFFAGNPTGVKLQIHPRKDSPDTCNHSEPGNFCINQNTGFFIIADILFFIHSNYFFCYNIEKQDFF